MSDQQVERETPASPDPGPSKAHGDAFEDQSGSRQGHPVEREHEQGGDVDREDPGEPDAPTAG